MSQRSFLQFSKDLIFRSLYGQNGPRMGKLKGENTKFMDGDFLRRTVNKLSNARGRTNEKLNTIALLFAKQCNAIAAQRIRRAMQIVGFYHNLGYDKQTIKKVVESLGSCFLRSRPGKPLYFLVGACLFSWEKERISEKEITDYGREMDQMYNTNKDDGSTANLPRETLGDSWEIVINRETLVVWRKPIDSSYLYEYKVFGSFSDIPARAFFNIQTDLECRKQWDKLIVDLNIVDRDVTSGCEVIQWIMHFPYPMYSREYLFVRKCVVDHEKKMMTMMSRATEHPSCPKKNNYVRVSTFRSHLVLKPHTSFDENGFDYILTYFDDPQAAIPSPAYNWMASTGVPDFVDKMHKAAMSLNDGEYTRTSRTENNTMLM